MINMFECRIKNTNMLLWVSILLLLDSGLALWHQNRIEKVLPRWNVRRFAVLEAFIALMLTGLHFWRIR